MRHCPHTPLVLVGMKCDLRIDVHEIQYQIDQGIRIVEKTEALQLAQNLGQSRGTPLSIFIDNNRANIHQYLQGWHIDSRCTPICVLGQSSQNEK